MLKFLYSLIIGCALNCASTLFSAQLQQIIIKAPAVRYLSDQPLQQLPDNHPSLIINIVRNDNTEKRIQATIASINAATLTKPAILPMNRNTPTCCSCEPCTMSCKCPTCACYVCCISPVIFPIK